MFELVDTGGDQSEANRVIQKINPERAQKEFEVEREQEGTPKDETQGFECRVEDEPRL